MSMKVIVFDVEHGACAFIKTPTNHTILIDCGCTEGFSPALYIARKELSDAAGWNGHKLTKMIVTHPHDDHITEIEAIRDNCPPALLLNQKYDWEGVKIAEDGDYDNLDAYTAWQSSYNVTPTHFPDYGIETQCFWLSPDEAKAIDESKFINNSSIVTIVTVKGTQFEQKFLFAGDMETAGWEALLVKKPGFKEAVKGVKFFIVPHHGHKSGFLEALFVAMGKPYLNIISIHHNDEHIDDRYSQEAYAVGVEIDGERRRRLTTRHDGTITIGVTDEGKYWIECKKLADNEVVKSAKSVGF